MKNTFITCMFSLLILGTLQNCVDAFPISVSHGGIFLGTIDPYTGGITGAANYGFSSASAHPVNGPTPVEREARIFMYDGSDGLNFTTIFSREDTNNVGAGGVDWDISITGSATATDVRLTDDGGELTEPSADFYRGRWNYDNRNTDGGVIGEIGSDAWTITIDPISYTNIVALKVFDDSGSFISLNLNTDSSGEIVLTTTIVPEPTTIALFGIGLAGLAGVTVRRRLRRKSDARS